MATAKTFLPLLVVVFFVHGSALVIMPVIPGIADHLQGGEATGTVIGVIFMAIGVAAATSSILMGLLAGRVGLRTVFILSAAAAAIFNVWPYFADTLVLFIASVFIASLMGGGLAGLASGLIAIRAPRDQQGAAFGASQAAISLGIALGPLTGGAAAVAFGLRSVFLVNSVVFLALLVLAALLLRPGKEPDEAPASRTPAKAA